MADPRRPPPSQPLAQEEPQRPPLSSLTEWSKAHIKAIFEATSKQAAVRAIRDTFAPQVKIYMNCGPWVNQNGREVIEDILLAPGGLLGDLHDADIRGKESELSEGLQVEWIHAVEVRDDADNRGGSVGGMYTIQNIRKTVGRTCCARGQSAHMDVERRKVVNVRIESQKINDEADSRRIVQLVVTELDIQSTLNKHKDKGHARL